MQLLTSLFTSRTRNPLPPLETRLIGSRVVLRAAELADWRSWRNLRDMSRDFLIPWEPEWPVNSLTAPFFAGMLRHQERDWRRGKAYGFLIFLAKNHRRNMKEQTGTLVGGITLNDVRRGIAQKATLGYWIGLPYARQGLMTEAAGLVCNFAFERLKLHRLEASCLPHNEPSKRLLKRLGFEEEGFAKSYLCINGVWQDHVLWGKAAR